MQVKAVPGPGLWRMFGNVSDLSYVEAKRLLYGAVAGIEKYRLDKV